jgi:hypothetical protein
VRGIPGASPACLAWVIWVNWVFMRLSCLAAALLLLVVGGVACIAGPPDADHFAATARRAGLRVLEGEHLVLVTDRPVREGDGVDELPRVFDAAFAVWCRHFGIDPAAHREWRALACLMTDRERFQAAGLLPTGGAIPDFANGYCLGARFWMMDQSSPAYRRHLLLHEGVHAFTLTLRDAAAPVWYTEGIAEHLATHRLDHGADGSARFIPTPIPLEAGDVEQLGRIEKIRTLRSARASPSLADVFATPPANHHALDSYAASWAAVALLAGHPAHADVFRGCECGPLDGSFTKRLEAAPGWSGSQAARDFDAFTDELDYGYDFTRSAIDWSAGSPLRGTQTFNVASDRGWQNSTWRLTAGQRCSLRATGRIQVGQASACHPSSKASACLLESEPDGISLEWYRGRPVGRLLAAQWVEEPAGGGRPRFVVLAEGAAGEFTAAADGPLYFKINESPGRLADNAGTFTVDLQ